MRIVVCVRLMAHKYFYLVPSLRRYKFADCIRPRILASQIDLPQSKTAFYQRVTGDARNVQGRGNIVKAYCEMKKEKERKEKQERNVHVSSSVCTFSKRDFISTGRRRGEGGRGRGEGEKSHFREAHRE